MILHAKLDKYFRDTMLAVKGVKHGGGFEGWHWHWHKAMCVGKAGDRYRWLDLCFVHPDGRKLTIRIPTTEHAAKGMTAAVVDAALAGLAEVRGISVEEARAAVDDGAAADPAVSP